MLNEARFKRRAIAVPNSIDRIKFELSTAVARCLKPSRATALYHGHWEFFASVSSYSGFALFCWLLNMGDFVDLKNLGNLVWFQSFGSF